MDLYIKPGDSTNIGRVGENGANRVIFDLSKFIAEYGDGQASLLIKQGGSVYEEVACERLENLLYWTISDSNTINPGLGQCQISYSAGDKIVKSDIYEFNILESIDYGLGEAPPPPVISWFNEIIKIGNIIKEEKENLDKIDEFILATEKAQEAKVEAEEAKAGAEAAQIEAEEAQGKAKEAQDKAKEAQDRAEAATVHPPIINNDTESWKIWDQETEDYIDTTFPSRGIQGERGFSGVYVGEDPIPDGYNVQINPNGDMRTPILSVYDESGDRVPIPAIKGESGFSPIFEVSKDGKKTTITINDADGEHEVILMDGADGAGTGDMNSATYDPNNEQREVAFKADVVPNTRTVNGKALSGDIALNAADVKAVSIEVQTLTDEEKAAARANIGAGTSDLVLGITETTAAKGNHTHSYVPTSRTINGKALSANIALNAQDIGAMPSKTIDAEPAEDSENLVTSGGVYTAIKTAIEEAITAAIGGSY